MAEHKIVVIGAGVIGLTTALLLSKKNDYNITIVAKHMPGDLDIEYTSPWAGAHYFPVGVEGSKVAEWERDTWPELARLAKEVPEAGIHFQEYAAYIRKGAEDSETLKVHPEVTSMAPWYKDVVYNFRIQRTNLPETFKAAQLSTSVCINSPLYLSWLTSQCLKNGVVVQRAVVKHILDAKQLHHSGSEANLIVNCAGIGAMKLGGVQDPAMFPIRGQTVLVRNMPTTMTSVHASDDKPDEPTYILPRAAGGGTILGGCYQVGEWSTEPDPDLAIRIMKRCVELCPSLTDGKGIEALSVIRHSVGLRPGRSGGPRLDKERINGAKIVHNYGHGSYGYQASYGTAQTALQLVDDSLAERPRL